MVSKDRYSRQVLFQPIGEEGQRKLANKKILIVGMGALGTVLANHLVRAGVGHVRFADRDYVEKSNLQRQMLFDEDDVIEALPKAVAAQNRLQKINSDVLVEGIVTDVTLQNIEELMEGVDLVLDGTDNFQTRFLINDACYQKGIPFVYGGAVSSRGMSAIFIPGVTPCLRCFIGGGNSAGQTCDTIGVISPVVDIVASFQAIEALKYLTDNHDVQRKSLITFDVWKHHMYEMKFSKRKENCPTCSLNEYPALQGDQEQTVTSLCGRETVQINLGQKLNIEEWAEKLAKVADVTKTPFLVRANLPEGERLVLFPDGRTLVQGTEDIARAKSLYARYIGL
ncbi:thiazole biosynthesis adenylyltransferase ThiF [Anaerobacillus alkaliphilus]|uniref:Thiazole biosynthesis adenylyltransferase ThiF n=1 Tax=Anaerobacillus alkaliphilus TaxID=1548597 RepID=A0A4Q0VRD4_9BACI|nr:ThiF family adenylyltransferase [Anaerobacillus alkaliphilus]RXI99452.1 thiazole biosynthesis adenylyltransferase ThiF [Anaerobacillus alkaliphilus]